MLPNDLQYLVAYIVGLIGDIFWAVGDATADSAADSGKMYDLAIGIFGGDGGLLFWCNEKLLWLMERIINGLWFTVVE
jgi:hypothetical protein